MSNCHRTIRRRESQTQKTILNPSVNGKLGFSRHTSLRSKNQKSHLFAYTPTKMLNLQIDKNRDK